MNTIHIFAHLTDIGHARLSGDVSVLQEAEMWYAPGFVNENREPVMPKHRLNRRAAAEEVAAGRFKRMGRKGDTVGLEVCVPTVLVRQDVEIKWDATPLKSDLIDAVAQGILNGDLTI